MPYEQYNPNGERDAEKIAQAERLREMVDYEPTSGAEKARFDALVAETGQKAESLPPEAAESLWEKTGNTIAKIIIGTLEAPGKAAEHLATPVMQALRRSLEQLTLAGRETLDNLTPSIIKAGGETLKTALEKLGEGTAIGASHIVEKIPPAAGKGAGGLVRGIASGLSGGRI
jgi:hypothetical protein